MVELVPKITVLLLIFVRVSAFFVSVPLFSYRTIPPQMRIALAFALSLIMYYTYSYEVIAFDGTYILLVLKEAIIGLMLGLIAYIIMSAVQIAGGFIDFQMGFAMANIVDPQTGAQSPLMGQFFNFLALLTMLAINGHHLLLDGIFYSYQFMPMNQLFPNFGSEATVDFILRTFTAVFAIAFQMSAPIIATLFLVTVALGITGKTVPQLSIFVIGFPIKIAVGFIVLIIMMGVMVGVMQKLIEMMIVHLRDLMVLLGGG
ncbi:flagellar biosynthetic protein FliR [Metasolibacillus meyeri]|uniref:Flagellar biosynthetic protein FliR n=1 Tax=Metasolibacillus meyeri TaxID=1071052 RepID=A0AAW9NU58_9BACL|nr:flagellar biosynthetic protein FliR [Metasolibacillus meyeri]MEC1179339.1 flagellar biosynthetic protein FliR [Metasolibacillus meyeri]